MTTKSIVEGDSKSYPSFFSVDETYHNLTHRNRNSGPDTLPVEDDPHHRHSSYNDISNADCLAFPKCSKKEHSLLSSHDDPSTPEGLSWKQFFTSKTKLKSAATSSRLLCGFAMVAAAELQVNSPEENTVPDWLWILYLLCTTSLISVHAFALMISTYILPNIEAVGELNNVALLSESPHRKFRNFIEGAWLMSNILGLLLFLIEMALLIWVKFWDFSEAAAICGMSIVCPVIILFILLAVHFYHKLLQLKIKSSDDNITILEQIKHSLDTTA